MEKFYYQIFPPQNFVDLSLYHFGYEECIPSHSFGPARRNHFLFHYILSGKGKFKSTDDKGVEQEYSLQAGQGFLIWPQQQTLYTADEKNPWVYAWVDFDGLKAREMVIQAGLTFNNPIYISKNSEEQNNMKNELLAIVNSRKDSPLSTMGHLYLFISALIASSSMRKMIVGGGIRNFYIREALTFIEQHYHENISVKTIADCCNLDRSYMGKIFKSELHSSPRDFLVRYRISKSCELMKITGYTISEIAEMVGYSNQFVFSRAFKSITGESPRNWRNENKYSNAPNPPYAANETGQTGST